MQCLYPEDMRGPEGPGGLRMERMPESIITILELWPDDPEFHLQHYAARCLRDAYAEIDRLNGPAQKKVRPEAVAPDPCGSPVICECGWIVGVMDEIGESILDDDHTARANYCGQCGAVMDYTEFDVQKGGEG